MQGEKMRRIKNNIVEIYGVDSNVIFSMEELFENEVFTIKLSGEMKNEVVYEFEDELVTALLVCKNVELDFAIIEGIFDKNKYGHHLFKKECFVGICSTTHPFAGKSVSLSDIFKEQLIVRENGSGTRKLLEQAIIDRGYSLQSFSQISSISNFSVICDVVAYNNAITFAYETIAHSHPNLAIFEFEDMKIQGEFNYVYCNENLAKQKIELFLNQIQTGSRNV